jgi:phosphatidylglycerophosphate synthase
MSMAPNLVTLIGTMAAFLTVVQFLPYDVSFSKTFPTYCYYLAALGCFIYQTFDAIDGK